MNQFYFTFGGYNNPSLRNKCVVIEANTESEARSLMFDNFSDHWAFCYRSKPSEEIVSLQEAIHLYEQWS